MSSATVSIAGRLLDYLVRQGGAATGGSIFAVVTGSRLAWVGIGVSGLVANCGPQALQTQDNKRRSRHEHGAL